MIEGVRGPGGGFKLRKHPSEIPISEIVEALEGPVLVAKCISGDGNPEERCARYEECTAVPILQNLERDFSRVLGSYTLSDVRVPERE